MLNVGELSDDVVGGVVDGVAKGVCLITVPLVIIEGDDDRQIRSLSSKFRSDSSGLSPNSHSRFERALARLSSVRR